MADMPAPAAYYRLSTYATGIRDHFIMYHVHICHLLQVFMFPAKEAVEGIYPLSWIIIVKL